MTTQNEFFEAERLRRYEQLLTAGIEDDRAWEVAGQAALDITEKKIAVVISQPVRATS